jgi:DNA polymerase-3 subunit alpha
MLKTYLDVKSGYSFLQSTLKVEDIVLTASTNKIESLALADINNMFGTMEFYKLCKKEGIKPLLGMDVTVIEEDGKSYSFLLYAINNDGYHNLTRLTEKVSRFDNKFGIPYSEFTQYVNDVIVILPIDRSYLLSLYKLGHINEVKIVIKRYLQDFKNVYLGINYDLGNNYNEIRQIAKQLSIKRVALPYVNCNNLLDLEVLRSLSAIKEIRPINENEEIRFGYYDQIIDNDAYYTFDELKELNVIVEKCNVDLDHFPFSLVDYKKISGVDSEVLLRSLCNKGLAKRLNNRITKEYQDRLDHELDVIIKMGFANYFLVVYDYVKFAKNAKMLVGPGRGSAAGSLVAYVLGITNVDPLKYGLMFERFLNSQRVTMPDIDIDFPDNRRQEVIDYLKSKYGVDCAAHVIAFQTFGARQSLRDVAKTLGLPLYQVDILVKKLPANDLFSSLIEFYDKYSQFASFIDNDPLYQRIFAIAKRIEGLPRQTSIHAAGMVISNVSLKEIIPIYYVDDVTVATQYDMNYIEEVGLLKMDILGLKNLTIIDDCVKDIEKYKNVKLDINNLNLEDHKVYQLISSGKTMGVFQIERSGMIQAIKTIMPNNFEDIVATIALYRPGPMQFIPNYALRKAGKEEVTYIHPLLEPILKYTYGIIIYQEQIIQILTSLAGFSLGRADIIRRAISKKDEKILSTMKNEFINGCSNNNIPFKIADDVFNLIERFADYGFNRSHSLSYALICYQMAYIKYYYPAIFYANILNAFSGSASLGGTTKFMQYINEASSLGIKIMLPSINSSQVHFSPLNDHEISYSLLNIKGVNQVLAANIVEERKKRSFDDIYDFVTRMYVYDINEKQLEALINAGCFDEFHINRASLRYNIATLLHYANMISTKIDGQIVFNETITSKPVFKFIQEDNFKSLQLEYEAIGLFLSGFPLAKDRPKLDKKGYVKICDIEEAENKRIFTVLYIQSFSLIKTKKGDLMASLKGYDETGYIEVVVFPNLYSQVSDLIRNNNYLKIDSKTQLKNDSISLIASRIQSYQLGEE